MTTDNDTDVVRRALRDATDDLAPGPDVLSRARHGGRRRQLRRRTALAGVAGVAVLAVLAAGAQLTRWPDRGPVTIPSSDVGDNLLTGPTGGDLAGDADYLSAATLAFRHGHRNPDPNGQVQPPVVFRHLVGSPHVAWAGTTPAGRAAIVAQATEVTDRSALGTEDANLYGRHVVLAFVAQGRDGTPAVLANEVLLTPTADTYNTSALRFGPDRSTLLVADLSRPVWYSTKRGYGPNGVRRNWTAVPFQGNAAVLTVRPGSDPATELVSAATPPVTDGQAEPVLVAGTPDPGTQPDNTLGWGGPPYYSSGKGSRDQVSLGLPLTAGAHELRGWGTARDPETFFDQALRDSPYYDANGFPAVGRRPWLAYAAPSKDVRVVGSEVQYGTDPSQIYAAVLAGGKTQIVWGGPAYRAATLPVHLRLPDNLGWLVAAYRANLSYRTATGTWQRAGTTAALLPPTATAVQVNGTTIPLA